MLSEHPAIELVAIIATPDDKWGERPKAFVELKDGESATEEDLLQFAKETLAGFKRPASVEFMELPKTSTGKLQKHLLREKEWEGHERNIG